MFTTSECGNSNFLMIMRGGGDDHALYDFAEAHFQQIGLLERAYADLPAYEAR